MTAKPTKILTVPGRMLIRAEGKDALDLLQRLVSADLTGLEQADGAAYTLLLTPQGKYLFDFFVVRHEGALYLDAPAAQAEALIAALHKYRLRSEASFTPITDMVATQQPAATQGVVSFADPRGDFGWRVWQPLGESAEGYDVWRIANGIVEPSQDMQSGVSIPLEFGLEKLNAISFGKGCFIGQELSARMQHRGLAKHEVVVVDAANVPEGATIIASAGGYSLIQQRKAT